MSRRRGLTCHARHTSHVAAPGSCPSCHKQITMVTRVFSTLMILATKKIQDTVSENISLTEDLQWLNKLGLLRTNILSQQLAENLSINGNADLQKQNYSHFYDPTRIKFYFTDSEKSPLKKAELFIINQTTIASPGQLQDKPIEEIDIDIEEEMITSKTHQTTKISTMSSLPYPIWISNEKSKKEFVHPTEKMPKMMNKRLKDRKTVTLNKIRVNHSILTRMKSAIRFYKNRFSNSISKRSRLFIEIAAFVASVLVMFYF